MSVTEGILSRVTWCEHGTGVSSWNRPIRWWRVWGGGGRAGSDGQGSWRYTVRYTDGEI